jgi:uncharacterized protein YodC (DUF2158 family)
MSLRIGNVVKLVSGGPLMTVYEITDVVSCMWWSEVTSEYMAQDFHYSTLEKVEFVNE